MRLFPAYFPPRHEHRTLATMLLLLHLVLWWDFGSAISRSLMLLTWVCSSCGSRCCAVSNG